MSSGGVSNPSRQETMTLVFDLARPYRAWLAIILIAMLVETPAASPRRGH